MRIFIDGKEYEVNKDKNLLDNCLSLGFDIPYFCYHPALGSIGACRLCAVKKFSDERDTNGKIVMSCMEPVEEGLRISTIDPEVKEFRAAVIESLMINHPHDCPVCDEGGDCHLQDMTVMTGYNYRRYEFTKRTFRNQELGPYINHEMNRCIQCYRCVRYYRDYAGGRDLNVFGCNNKLYFGRAEDGQLENDFSGNLVEVCPTGVFTDKTLKKHYTRKWDLTNSPSICPHCSVGCNIIISERYGVLRRVINRYNSEINGYFICDKGRFGYEFVNSDRRIKNILLKKTDSEEYNVINKNELKNILNSQFSILNSIIGIGSSLASLESNYALKQLVGKENFYTAASRNEYDITKKILDIYSRTSAKIPTLKEIEKADAVLILGEDISETAPMTSLAVRQSVKEKPLRKADKLRVQRWKAYAYANLIQDKKGPLIIATNNVTKLDDIASHIFRGSADDITLLAKAIKNNLASNNSPAENISSEIQTKAKNIADALKAAKNPLVISGTACGNAELIRLASDIAESLQTINNSTNLNYIVPDCNSIGLFMLGVKPLDDIIKDNKKINCAIILENDNNFQNEELLDYLNNNCKDIILLNYLNLNHQITKLPNCQIIQIPIATFAESNGTYVNNEGRAQRFYSVFPYNDEVKESWKWLLEVRNWKLETGTLNQDKNPASNFQPLTSDINELEELRTAIIKDYPIFKGIQEHSPYSLLPTPYSKIPRQQKRYSGRTAINAGNDVSEPKPPEDNETPLSFSMEGNNVKVPSSLNPFYWAPGWNSGQALNKYQRELSGHLKNEDVGIKLNMKLITKE